MMFQERQYGGQPPKKHVNPRNKWSAESINADYSCSSLFAKKRVPWRAAGGVSGGCAEKQSNRDRWSRVTGRWRVNRLGFLLIYERQPSIRRADGPDLITRRPIWQGVCAPKCVFAWWFHGQMAGGTVGLIERPERLASWLPQGISIDSGPPGTLRSTNKILL